MDEFQNEPAPKRRGRPPVVREDATAGTAPSEAVETIALRVLRDYWEGEDRIPTGTVIEIELRREAVAKAMRSVASGALALEEE